MRTEKRSARKRKEKYFLTRWKWIFFSFLHFSCLRAWFRAFSRIYCVLLIFNLSRLRPHDTCWSSTAECERKSGPRVENFYRFSDVEFIFCYLVSDKPPPKNSSIFLMESIKLEFVWPFPLHASTSICHATCQATSRTDFDDFGPCWGSSTLPNYVDFAAAACCACYKFKFMWKFSSCLALKLFLQLIGLFVTRKLFTVCSRHSTGVSVSLRMQVTADC